MSFKSKWRRLAFASVMLASTSMAQAGIDKPVKTAQGLVKGTAALKPGVTVFKGIPSPRAPVGKLRFMSAVPVKTSWKGVRDGSKWGDTCVQPPAPTRAMGVNQATDMPDLPKISEDRPQSRGLDRRQGGGREAPRHGLVLWRRLFGRRQLHAVCGRQQAGGQAARSSSRSITVSAMFGFMSHPDATALSGQMRRAIRLCRTALPRSSG